jgi:O-antigen ligase
MLVFTLLMPFNGLVVSYSIGLIFLIWLSGPGFGNVCGLFRHGKKHWWILSFSLLYLLYLAGLAYTKNLSYAREDMQTKLSLLLFPLMLSMTDDGIFDTKKIHTLLRTFISGVFLCTLTCLVHAFIQYFASHSKMVFYYTNLSWFQHTTYLSMYIGFTITLLFYFLLLNRMSKMIKVLIILLIVYFSVFIVLLSSKAGILTLSLVMLVMAFYLLFFRRRVILGISLIGSVVLFFLLASFLFPTVYSRIERTRKAIENFDSGIRNSEESTDVRLLIWTSAVEIIREHPLSGVGTGDVKDALLEKYNEKGMTDAFSHRLNAHNQFLQTGIAIGIAGMTVLIGMFILALIYAIKNRNIVYLLFLGINAVNFLFESILETQNGVVFYAFFNAFLFYKIKELRWPE